LEGFVWKEWLDTMAFYIAPQFIDKLAVHITKNYLDLPNVKVPLILGIHGRKGEGKSFQCDLVFERMNLEVVYMSAGELESPDAGDPARLIRLRYREAGELSRIRGKMAVLMINDIDAGVGRVDALTQYTVNTQLVHGTLMNIADNPTNVQLPGSYDSQPTQRIPIIVTGNDFSTLYAPLIRDGRMDKYYWEPSRADRIGIVSGIFEVDHVSQQDVEQFVDAFPGQSIDFFGAVRSRLYDEQVQRLIQDIGVEKISARVVNGTEALPEFRRPDFRLGHLLEVGQAMVREQQRIQELRLVEEYNQSIFQNRRLGETDSLNPNPSLNASPPSRPTSLSYEGDSSATKLTAAIVGEVNQILQQGWKLGIEYVDDRRFRTGSWHCYGTFQGQAVEAIAALEQCLNEHDRDHIRIVGIEPKDRRRISEVMVQRANSSSLNGS
jgi:ribulose bisphosphate carboxylase small subunit